MTHIESPDTADLVAVGHAYGQMEAQMACAMLESAGIFAHPQTRQTASVAWHYTVALGGIAVLVPRSRAHDALAILADFKPERSRPLPFWLVLLGVLTLLWAAIPLPPSGYFAARRPDRVATTGDGR